MQGLLGFVGALILVLIVCVIVVLIFSIRSFFDHCTGAILLVNVFVGVEGLDIVRIGLSLDLGEQVRSLPLEERVLELDLVGRSLALVEVVHVQLADERVKIAMFEKGW